MSLDIDLARGVFEVTDSGFSTLKRHMRKRASGNSYKITAGSTLTMAANRRINTGQPWLPFEFNNGALTRAFESTNVSGYADAENVATPSPTVHDVTIDDATEAGPSKAFDITAGRIIGMDGATFSVLDLLTSRTDPAGAVMPFLSKVFRDGARAKLRSTPNPLTPPAWVSLMTGRTPGHHGVYDFIRAEERNDDVFFTLYDSRDCRVETIWSIASRQGRRVAALNFPFTAPPPKDLNGFMVPGFVPWRHLRRNTAPADLYDRLKQIPDFNAQATAGLLRALRRFVVI